MSELDLGPIKERAHHATEHGVGTYEVAAILRDEFDTISEVERLRGQVKTLEVNINRIAMLCHDYDQESEISESRFGDIEEQLRSLQPASEARARGEEWQS